ncbi:MAG: thioredoxin family protein [Micropepsaceae bacterium]
MLKPLLLAAALVMPAAAAPVVGEAAPAFTGKDTKGETVNLSDFAGKTVILEWTNNGCPYVKKHYGSGNMQKTQEAATAEGVVWLTIISSHEGKQGYVTPAEADAITAEHKATPTDVILDTDQAIARAYEAKTTPHMFVIDPAGKLVYAGAIDDKPTADPKDLETANNLVLAALDDVKNGRPVATPESEPYGCAVKY